MWPTCLPTAASVHGHWHLAPVSELIQRGRQPAVGKDAGMDALDEFPQVGHELLGLLVRVGHGRGGG
jgi:hypothetical protein